MLSGGAKSQRGEPVFGWSVPGGQSVQFPSELAPGFGANVPAAHVAQSLPEMDPKAVEYRPAGQGLQLWGEREDSQDL